jgi:hypothetical protein
MFIGPKGITALQMLGKDIATFDNPVFGVRQALVEDGSASMLMPITDIPAIQLAGTAYQPEVVGPFTPLENVLAHFQLLEAYPHLRCMPVVNSRSLPTGKDWAKEWGGAAAAFIPGNGKSDLIVIDPGKVVAEGVHAILHEIQHAIQNYEGYFAGHLIFPTADAEEAQACYYASPQEREALNVEARFWGSKKLWFKEVDPKCAGYPKRLDTNKWTGPFLEFMRMFLQPNNQKALFDLSLEAQARKSRDLTCAVLQANLK